MTLLNPVPFASFAILVTSLKVFKGRPDLLTDFCFAISLTCGTALFWLVVNEILHHARRRSPQSLSLRISQGTSVALLVFGVILAAKSLL